MDDYLGECLIIHARAVAWGRVVWGPGWRWDLMPKSQMKETLILCAWKIQDMWPLGREVCSYSCPSSEFN